MALEVQDRAECTKFATVLAATILARIATRTCISRDLTVTQKETNNSARGGKISQARLA